MSPTYACLVFDQILLEPSVIIIYPAVVAPRLNTVGDEGYSRSLRVIPTEDNASHDGPIAS